MTKHDQIDIQLRELDITAQDIADGDISGDEAALEIRQRISGIRESIHSFGWKNAASAENGKKGGRPRKEQIDDNVMRQRTDIVTLYPATKSRKIEFNINDFADFDEMLNAIGGNLYGYATCGGKVIVRIPYGDAIPGNASESKCAVMVWHAPRRNSEQRKHFNYERKKSFIN